MFRWEIRSVLRGALALLLFVGGVWAAEAQAQGTDFRTALKLIGEKLHRRFPYLEGQIVAVKGGDLYLSIGEKNGATKGIKLNIYRKGKPFRHPVTGVVLGTLEDEIGVANVVEVREKFSIARLVRLTPGSDLVPKVKDIVRLSSAKVRIGVLPFLNKTKESFSTSQLTRELSRVLLSQGRFDVYDTDSLQVWLLETGIAVDQLLKGQNPIRLRNRIKSDLALENTILDLKGKKVISSRLYSLTNNELLFEVRTLVDELPFEQGAPKEKTLRRGEGTSRVAGAAGSVAAPRGSLSRRRRGVSSFVFNGLSFRGVSIADIDKDGKNELLVISTNELIAYQISEGQMREVARYSPGVANDFRWVDAADMNGNGRPEIYIASYRYDDLLSTVLEFRNGKFVTLLDNEGTFFRTIRIRRAPGDGKTKIPDKEAFLLLGQAQGLEKPFSGPIYRYKWAGRKLVSVSPYTLPERLQIIGFGLWDLDQDGSLDVVEVGRDDKLRIFSRRGEIRFEGAGFYGAPILVFAHGIVRGVDAPDATDSEALLAIRPRIMVEDLDNDGIKEVLVVSNQYSGTRFAPDLGVAAGQVVSLIWDGNGLSEIWRSKRVDGGVSDFTYGDADNDGRNDLVIVTPGATRMTGRKSHILIYQAGR